MYIVNKPGFYGDLNTDFIKQRIEAILMSVFFYYVCVYLYLKV